MGAATKVHYVLLKLWLSVVSLSMFCLGIALRLRSGDALLIGVLSSRQGVRAECRVSARGADGAITYDNVEQQVGSDSWRWPSMSWPSHFAACTYPGLEDTVGSPFSGDFRSPGKPLIKRVCVGPLAATV